MRSMSEETGHSVLIQLRLNDSPISQKRNIKKLDKNGTVDLIISQTKTPIPISFVFRVLKVATIDQLKFLIGDEEELDKYLIKIVEETSDGGIFDDMEIEISQEDDFNEENEESTEKKKITQFIEQDMFPHWV